jgi:hypothetical protein
MLANTQKDYRVCIVVADQCALLVSLVLAIVLRSYLPQQVPFAWPSVVHAAIAFRHIGFAALWYFSMRSVGAYELNAEEGWGVWRAFKGVVLFTLVAYCLLPCFLLLARDHPDLRLPGDGIDGPIPSCNPGCLSPVVPFDCTDAGVAHRRSARSARPERHFRKIP